VFDPYLDYTTPVTETITGHFGFTLIRASVFRDLPKPWFITVPLPDGNYPPDGTGDSDIVFWRTMAENGYRIAQVNDVQVGHMEIGVRCIQGEKTAIIPIHMFRTMPGVPGIPIDWKAIRRHWCNINHRKVEDVEEIAARIAAV
jgi:hypothetical protein